LTITDPVIPSGSRLIVEVFIDGLGASPEAIAVLPGQQSRSVSWQAQSVELIHFSVRPLGTSSPAMSYDVIFADDSGATLPIEPINERTIYITSGGVGGGSPNATGSQAAQITPGDGSLYERHLVEFPGYSLTTAGDPSRIEVTMRSATLFERSTVGAGNSFPVQSGALVVIETRDARGQLIGFDDEAHITVQFVERPEPWRTDVVTLSGTPGEAGKMRLVGDMHVGSDVDFQLLGGLQFVDVGAGTVTSREYLGLTGADGIGAWGAVVDPDAVPPLPEPSGLHLR
jgi:hypothetical protein